jgi:hypothetical protein
MRSIGAAETLNCPTGVPLGCQVWGPEHLGWEVGNCPRPRPPQLGNDVNGVAKPVLSSRRGEGDAICRHRWADGVPRGSGRASRQLRRTKKRVLTDRCRELEARVKPWLAKR